MAILIKRYPNRKLYNTQAKQYITLQEVGTLVQRGEEVCVVEHLGGEDITAIVFSQVILDLERKQTGSIPHAILTSLIQTGGHTLEAVRLSVTQRLDLQKHVDVEIERRLNLLVQAGDISTEEGARLAGLLSSTDSETPEKAPTWEALIHNLLEQGGLPSRQMFDDLNKQLDALSDIVDALDEHRN